MTAAAPAARRDQIPRAILYMAASTVVFAGVNATVKWEVAIYPIGEVAFVRSLFALVTCLVIILPRTGLGVLRTGRIGDHVKRGLSQFCSMTSMFIAFRLMSLGGAIAIGFSAPLFTTLLSIVVLKERVGVHRWSALIVGFLGVLLVTRPGAGSLQIGAAFALANAVLISTVAIAIRRMSATESSETLTLYQMAIITVLTAATLVLGCPMPGWHDGLMLAAAGVGNGVAQYWWTKSLSLAPPSAVVPFNYLSLVWATIIGFFVWGDVPDAALLVGSVIVVGSGLYILWRETLRRTRIRTARALDARLP